MKILAISTCILLSTQIIQSMEKIDALIIKMRPKLDKVIEGLKAIDAMDKEGFNKWNTTTKVDENGNTRLHFAVLLPAVNIVELSKTEDIEAANKYGITPIIVALYNGNLNAIASIFLKNEMIVTRPELIYGFSFQDWIAITQAYKNAKNDEKNFEKYLRDELIIVAQSRLK